MIITTTNNIEGKNINKYIGVVCANIVLGVNVISDIMASFSDFFGGQSNTYEGKLEKIYKDVYSQLENKAVALKANAIVGVHIDFDEVSGGGKSMFMVSATGTAVILDEYENDRYAVYRKLNEIHDYYSKGFMNQTEYEFEKENIINSFKNTIPQESELSSQQKELEKNRKERENKELFEREKLLEEARKSILEKSQVTYTGENIQLLSEIEILSACYDSIPITNSGNLEHTIAKLIRLNKVPEACKYYVDETGLNFRDAITFVSDTYNNIATIDSDNFNKLVAKLRVLKKKNFVDQAIREYIDYSFADRAVAESFINQL